MANHQKGSVLFVDTSEAFPHIREVCGIKYLGAATSSVKVRADASDAGSILWEDDASTDKFDQVELRDSDGLYVEVSGTASAYLYLPVR